MEIRVGDDPAALAADSIARRLRGVLGRRPRATLAMSGGGTAPAMIAVLGRHRLAWPRVDVFQVDERIAPDGDPARNAGQLAPLAAAGAEIRPMPVTAADLRSAARRYAAALPERVDVIHLGIGADGHTASWPPGDPVGGSDRPVEIVEDFHGFGRMTITARVVNDAGSRVVLAIGAEKRPVVERWLLDDPRLPISLVRRSRTTVFVDPAAAPAVTDGV